MKCHLNMLIFSSVINFFHHIEIPKSLWLMVHDSYVYMDEFFFQGKLIIRHTYIHFTNVINMYAHSNSRNGIQIKWHSIKISSQCYKLCLFALDILHRLVDQFEGSNVRVRGVSGAGWGVDSASATYAAHMTVGALKQLLDIQLISIK